MNGKEVAEELNKMDVWMLDMIKSTNRLRARTIRCLEKFETSFEQANERGFLYVSEKANLDKALLASFNYKGNALNILGFTDFYEDYANKHRRHLKPEEYTAYMERVEDYRTQSAAYLVSHEELNKKLKEYSIIIGRGQIKIVDDPQPTTNVDKK